MSWFRKTADLDLLESRYRDLHARTDRLYDRIGQCERCFRDVSERITHIATVSVPHVDGGGNVKVAVPITEVVAAVVELLNLAQVPEQESEIVMMNRKDA